MATLISIFYQICCSVLWWKKTTESFPRQFEHINLSKTKWCQSLSCGPCIPLRPVSMAMPVHLCRASLSGGTPRDLGRECKRERWGLGGGALRRTLQCTNRQRIREFRRDNGQLWEIVLFRCSTLSHSELYKRRSGLAFQKGRPRTRLLKLLLPRSITIYLSLVDNVQLCLFSSLSLSSSSVVLLCLRILSPFCFVVIHVVWMATNLNPWFSTTGMDNWWI